MKFLQKPSPSVFKNPALWFVLIGVFIFILLGRVFFMNDRAVETGNNHAILIFFRQDVQAAEIPGLLRQFGADGCVTIGGGTHVFECTDSQNPEEVLEVAGKHPKVFDTIYQENQK